MCDPFLKWAGGKRWLASSADFPDFKGCHRYIEPFLGGGAVFFSLKPDVAILSDLNGDLIDVYTVIKDSPDDLRSAMLIHQENHSRQYYYQVRANVPEDKLLRAARFLYLNRTCWNGLYRVNLKGEFNVPIGTKNTVLYEKEDFSKIAQILCKAKILHSDFEETIGMAQYGDFLFIDPPYTVRHNVNGFVKYNEKIFSWADQVRLRDAVAGAIRRGVRVALTNADHPSIWDLYEGLCCYKRLHRPTVLAGKGGKRGQTTEALFTANV